jgi:hypothetical protein
MARVIYAYPVSELIGSIGGVTFQRNSSGKTARSKPNMTMNPSPGQAVQQYNLSRLVAFWPTLSQAQKDTWTTYLVPHPHVTPWGESKLLNGYQWFLSCNLNMLLANEGPTPVAPSWYVVSPPPVFTLTAVIGNLYAHFAAPWSVTPDHIFVYLTLPLRQSSLKLRRSLFLIDINDTFNDDDLILTSFFESLINVVWADFFNTADANIICRLMVIRKGSGLASPFTSGIVKIS